MDRREYKSLVQQGSSQGITCDYIGLGSLRTWHGSPDCSARGGSNVQVILPRQEDVDTDGGSMKHEAKLVIKRHKKSATTSIDECGIKTPNLCGTSCGTGCRQGSGF